MKNADHEGQIFLSHPHTINGLFAYHLVTHSMS